MATVMTAQEFVKTAEDIAMAKKTLYVMGCFGAPMTAANKARYCQNNDYNKQESRRRMIMAASADTFGFDCVCLIKAILWGWTGDVNKIYGGAGYAINGVPDIGAGTMMACCDASSGGWLRMLPGEAVWMKGHIGIYIGNGKVVECSPRWENRVQITAVENIGKISGLNGRTWTKHGKLPWISYESSPPVRYQKPVLGMKRSLLAAVAALQRAFIRR